MRKKLQALQTALAAVGADVKWVEPGAMHITLLFLGELDDRDLAEVCKLTAKAAGAVESFRLSLAGLGAFPNLRRPKVLWAGIDEGQSEIRSLFAAIEEPLAEIGIYRKEDRPYTPHLTLGRIADAAGGALIVAELPKYEEWTAGPTAIEEVQIMSSEMRRSGPEYAVIGRARLR